MESGISINDLMAVNLQYDPGAAALGNRASAQLTAKLLYACGRGVSRSLAQLTAEAATILETRRLSEGTLQEGLSLLERSGMAECPTGRWLLTDKGYHEIDADVNRAVRRTTSILDRHFRKHLDRTALTDWFVSASVAFYGLYGTQWAAGLFGQTPRRPLTPSVLSSALREATRQSTLREHAEELLEGFHRFLHSADREDIDHQWSLGQAMLASRLVAANVGPDAVTVARFRGATFLLDTNVLLVSALEAHNLSGALKGLGEALQHLDVTIGYIDQTKDEYGRVVYHNRNQVLSIIEDYPTRVLRDSDDPFIRTALERQCHNTEDFATFFDEMMDPPGELPGGLVVNQFVSAPIEQAARHGEEDATLKQDIALQWRRLRGRAKGPRATEHDAALTTVVESLSTDSSRWFVLSLDRTMNEHALRRAGPSSIPRWVSLDGLLQVLAVDAGAPGVDPAVFAPLMASIIRHQCEPVMNTYTAEDLGLLLDIEDRCSALRDEDIKSLASEVARARLSGRPRRDPELQLMVKRGFQKSRVDETTDLREQVKEVSAEARAKGHQLVVESKRHQKAKVMFVDVRGRDHRRRAKRTAWIKGVGALGLGTALAWAAITLSVMLTTEGSTSEFVVLTLSLIGPAGAAFGYILRTVVPEWRVTIAESDKVAAEEFEASLAD